jgi:hypothetical protein
MRWQKKWMSQKDHAILSLIRLNVNIYRRYIFSYSLSLLFQTVYLSLTPPLTLCIEEKRNAILSFSHL